MLRFEKRENVTRRLKILVPLLSVFLGLAIGAIAIALAGINPLTAFRAIVVGSFGSKYTFTETLVFATPLILISVGLILAFKMNFWNIGAYGQYLIGAIASSYFALFLPATLSKPLFLAIMTVAGLLGGALWAFIPAMLKAYWDVNEVIATLLLNYVALYFLKYLMYGPWRDPTSHGFPLSKTFPDNAQLYKIIPQSRVHLGLIFGIIAAFLIWYIIKKTKFGYETRIIGGSKAAALYAGINVRKDVVIAMLISGALAGLAGMAQVSGVIHLLQIEINPDYGYTAIIAAWLSYLEPFTAVFVSILLGALAAGGYQIQITMQVPFGIVSVIESSILFALIGSEILLRYSIHFDKKRR